MKRTTMNVLMFFIFANHMLHIFGKVTVLRGSLLSKYPNKVKLMCLSEDDGGALVWNHNLNPISYHSEAYSLPFRNLNESSNEINCKMNANAGCSELWTKHDSIKHLSIQSHHWKLTNSLITPMTPTLDIRWNDFIEYVINENTHRLNHKLPKQNLHIYDDVDVENTEIKFSFSVRGSHDAHILICNGKYYSKDFCYWIIIGGWGNTLSVVRKCAMGVPMLWNDPKDEKCKEALVSFERKLLSEKKYRTFVIAWNYANQSIIVYHNDEIIMRYVDKDKRLPLNEDYYLFIRSSTMMFFRFYIYDFLHTTVENAVLKSPTFEIKTEMCLELFVGLCADCDASIILRDITTNDVVRAIKVKGVKTIYGLPTWQYNTIYIKHNENKVIIQLIPKLNKCNSNPLWAIANVRPCNHEYYKFINKYPELDCKMNANTSCLKLWTKNESIKYPSIQPHGWKITNSLITPMGPVFDERWEEFSEYKSQTTYHHVDFKFPEEVKLSFSIRGYPKAHILICKGKNYKKDLCYWIIIGINQWGIPYTIIRKCKTGVYEPESAPRGRLICKQEIAFAEHELLSESEWRSFIITWNSMIQKIVLYDTDKILQTYVDKDKPTPSDYHMFIRSDRPMLFRFHKYDFLHTTVENAALISPTFQFKNKIICVRLFVGLCAECDAFIILRDSTNNKVLATVTAKGSKAIHGLPMWQSIKIEKNFSATDYNAENGVIIQLIPKLNKCSLNPLWAISNVRQCHNGALKEGIMISSQDYEKQRYFWPTETCQKLFYDQHVVVNHLSDIKPNISLDDANCPEGKIGPQCLFSCKRDLNSYSDCTTTKICYENGCTCTPGFKEKTCAKPCDQNKYGHECKETCGLCLFKKSCNKVTGVCSNGCDNTKRIYLPPLCKTSIRKPEAPRITLIKDTTIKAVVPIRWKDGYDEWEKPILYSFTIQEKFRSGLDYKESWNKLYRNTTLLTGYFKNLKPSVIYNIGISLNIAGKEIHSNQSVAETTCNPIKNFNITPKKDAMVIDWQLPHDRKQLYTCPSSSYEVIVRNISTNEKIVSATVTSFPYQLQHLPSYTSFNVTVYQRLYHKNDEYNYHKLFSQKIRTLEGVPSKVLDLRSKLANTKLTLMWKPPREPNGKIVRYEVILKVKEYFGCRDLKMSTPNNHIITKSTTEPTITIPDLHPYTSYSAQVKAYNSINYSIAETTFETAQSDVASEVFRQLTIENWRLSWKPPEDCTTISGPLFAKIKLDGISDAVKHVKNDLTTTSDNYLNLNRVPWLKLHGIERYMATVYVIRDMSGDGANDIAYQTLEFETPPKAPPEVTNLEVVEIDTRRMPTMLHLRWQSPLPPLNGKLRYYGIELCETYNEVCSVTYVQLYETCDLWDNYICKVIKKPTNSSQTIKVVAYNINVTEPGLSVSVTDDMLHNNTVPNEPRNYTFTMNNNSVVDLKWLHPWKTGGHLKSFRIRIQEISSNLRKRFSRSLTNETLEYPVIQYMRNYSKQLYLFPSTQYLIHIQAVTIENKSSNTKFIKIRTPSAAAFDGVLSVIINKFNSTILLNIPSITNDTQDSVMHIVVKGPNLCQQHLEMPEILRVQADMKTNETAWLAAEVSTNEFAGKQFEIGDNNTYGNATNCPLKSEEFYTIVVIVTERNSSVEPIVLTKLIFVGMSPSMYYEAGLILVILFVVITVPSLCCYRRTKQKWIVQNEVVTLQNIRNREEDQMK